MPKIILKSSSLILTLTALIIGSIIIFITSTNYRVQHPQITGSPTRNSDLNSYSSSHLKFSLEYPKNWFLEEDSISVRITSYPVEFGYNKDPNNSQIRIYITGFYPCYPTLEEDLIDFSCGESVVLKKNTILSKESRKTNGGTFYIYLIKQGDTGKNVTFYFLEKDKENILQISKESDPSQFEKEFEEIVNSIQFVD